MQDIFNQLGNILKPETMQSNKQTPKPINFYHEGDLYTATATRFNDAFYTIESGQFKGNLVHIFNVKNPK